MSFYSAAERQDTHHQLTLFIPPSFAVWLHYILEKWLSLLFTLDTFFPFSLVSLSFACFALVQRPCLAFDYRAPLGRVGWNFKPDPHAFPHIKHVEASSSRGQSDPVYRRQFTVWAVKWWWRRGKRCHGDVRLSGEMNCGCKMDKKQLSETNTHN